MIVFVIGGHGSGKTTAVRKLVESRSMRPATAPGRRLPVGYEDEKMFLMGHYEMRNGGADTVRPLRRLESLARSRASRGLHVVMEGVGQAGIQCNVSVLARKFDVSVVLLTTSQEECFRSVRRRGHKLSMDGVRRAHVKSTRMAETFEKEGIPVHRVTRSSVVDRLRELTR